MSQPECSDRKLGLRCCLRSRLVSKTETETAALTKSTFATGHAVHVYTRLKIEHMINRNEKLSSTPEEITNESFIQNNFLQGFVLFIVKDGLVAFMKIAALSRTAISQKLDTKEGKA